MSDKLPMTLEQIAEELLKCFPPLDKPNYDVVYELVAVVEHILRIGTTELREENKRLRSGEFICKKCWLRKDADNFFKDGVPF